MAEHIADNRAAHDLAQYIINTNSGAMPYEERCEAARGGLGLQVAKFSRIAHVGAARYSSEFSEEDITFNAATVLLAAVELADYYGEHVAEMDALDTA